MPPTNEISEQQPHMMTDSQRHYLQNIVREVKPALLILVGIFATFFIVLVMIGISKSIDAASWLVFFGIFMFIFWGLSFFVSSYWQIRRDVKEMVLDSVEGIIRLSITKQSNSSSQDVHEIIIGKAKFHIPQDTYLQFKDGHSYRVFYTRHSKIFMCAEFGSTIGQGVHTIHRSDLSQSAVKSKSRLENFNIVDEYAVKLKRDMADDYRTIIFQRFRRDTLTALVLIGVFGLPFLCAGVASITITPYQAPASWLIFGLSSIPSACITLALLYDYWQLYRDLRAGTLHSFDGSIRIQGGVGTNYLNVENLQSRETKSFNISREMIDGLVERQMYRVYFTPHSKIFVYAEKL